MAASAATMRPTERIVARFTVPGLVVTSLAVAVLVSCALVMQGLAPQVVVVVGMATYALCLFGLALLLMWTAVSRGQPDGAHSAGEPVPPGPRHAGWPRRAAVRTGPRSRLPLRD
jgi:hypothetical protein